MAKTKYAVDKDPSVPNGIHYLVYDGLGAYPIAAFYYKKDAEAFIKMKENE